MDTSAEQRDEFPRFRSGDVLVVIAPTRMYHLHRDVLRRSSTHFDRLLKAEGPVLSKKRAKTGQNIRFRLALVGYEGSYSFTRIELNSEGVPVDGSAIELAKEDGRAAPKEYKHFHMLFESFYNNKLKLDETSLTTLLRDAVGITTVAETVGSIHLVTKTIESSLLAYGQELFQNIAQAPQAWIDLACRISSRILFKESLIHVVGRYNELSVPEEDEEDDGEAVSSNFAPLDVLKPYVRQNVERKAKELKDMCRAAEQFMVTFYPPNLHRQSITGRADRDPIGRSHYANDIMSWMALSLFRHYLGQHMANDLTHNDSSGGIELYRNVAKGGEAYLSREEVLGFHQRFPMSAKGQAVFSNHLGALKEAVKPYVANLMTNKSQLDVISNPVNWLTCIEVRPSDYPWESVSVGIRDDDSDAVEDDEEMDAAGEYEEAA